MNRLYGHRWVLRVCSVGIALALGHAQNGPDTANRRVLKADGEPGFGTVWVNEDVRWLITDRERAAFNLLKDDREREFFIDTFWLRRDPTPDTIENEFKEEHYRRMAYANQHFGARDMAGWESDRGRVYIVFGPPDAVNVSPRTKPLSQATDRACPPWEDWYYRYIEERGSDVHVHFVDSCSCGEYLLDRYSASGGAIFAVGPSEVDTLNPQPQGLVRLVRPPGVQFKNLEEIVTVKLKVNLLPITARTDFVPVTHATDMVTLRIDMKNADLTFVIAREGKRASVEVFGRLATLAGRIAESFEGTMNVDVAEDELSKPSTGTSAYVKVLALPKGLYRLDLAVKDKNADRVGSLYQEVDVP
jgi:GWxTD domain-containing protein